MSNPSALDLTIMAATDDVSPVLPRFRPLWWLKNQDLCSFDLKTSFTTHLDLKHRRNHDKLIHGPKKQTRPKTKKQHEPRSVLLQIFKV
jgi:hypothetical protein